MNSLQKTYLVPPDLVLPGGNAIARSTNPFKRRMLTELKDLADAEIGTGVEEAHPLHPFLRSAIAQSHVQILQAGVPGLEELLDNMLAQMRNVHIREPNYKGDFPSDFDDTCLIAGIVGPEAVHSRDQLRRIHGHARTEAMKSGLMVARHFSDADDLALLAVRRMLGPDGQHLSGGSRSRYEDFFARSAW